jgi:hypothetical protein
MLAEHIMKWKSIFNGNAKTKENNKWYAHQDLATGHEKL